jgi:hypothetical protein
MCLEKEEQNLFLELLEGEGQDKEGVGWVLA